MRRRRSLSLKLLLILPFVIQVFGAVGLVGYLSFRNGQKSVENLAQQLMLEVRNNISERLKTYLTTPHIVNQLNQDALELGQLNLENLQTMEQHFWRQSQIFDLVSYIQFGSVEGEFVGLAVNDDQTFRYQVTESTGALQTYAIDEQGNRGEFLETSPNFDSRLRPWYIAPQQADRPTWTEIYPWVNPPTLAITLGQPYYDQRGKFQGILATDLTLAQISDFLNSLKIGDTGQTFILESSGLLVATSVKELPFTFEGETPKRLLATESQNLLTRAAVNYLKDYFGDLTKIDNPQTLSFRVETKPYFLQVNPLQDEHGLNWLGVIVIPESDFMAQIDANTRINILLCFTALGLATVSGIYTSRWITQPITKLIEASQEIAQGNLAQTIDITSVKELGVLTYSFNQMAKQLQISFTTLEKVNEDLEAEISDRKTTEIALEKSRTELKQANRAKDSFIAHISHELRTPLNSILGFSSILQKDTELTATQLHYINIINNSGQHLLNLINQILDVSKISAQKLELEPQNINLRQFFREIIEIFSLRTAQKGLEFSSYISSSLPTTVNTDPTRLRQILYNLLSNAIKFTPTGKVTLKVAHVKDFEVKSSRESCPISESSSLTTIRFQIEDTGIGVPTEQFAAIFAPFEQLQTDAAYNEGTGLGLTISQEIVQLMGSKIQIESQVDQGSKFWFDLELLAVETPQFYPLPKFSSQLPRRLRVPRKILVVDDNYDNRTLLVNYLQPFGFEIAEANNGEVGLTTAQTFQPDAILVDLLMPIMDGKEMIARLRKQEKFQDCIFMIISASSQSLGAASEIGCHELLPKPVNLEQLMTLLEEHLQLDWLISKSTTESDNHNSSKLVTPPQETLVKLLELAELGDMEEIKQQINSLAALDEQYTLFVQEIRQLTSSFQQERLEIFIKNFIDA